MKKSKRVISLLLSVVMILSVFQAGFVAFAADGTQYVLDATEAKQLADAGAVATATQVVRVASTLYSYDLGTTIVPATPSGIPANDERGLANAGNVNETASYPTVKITFKDLPSEVPQITCVNTKSAVSNVVMSVAIPNTTEKSYTWQIASGTANAGDTLKFRITYTYNGREYTSYAYSYVENIAMPAGNVVTTESKYESGLFGWGTNYYAGVSAATRVLGINTYGSLESFTVGSSDLRGYYDASANAFVTRSGADYATYNVMRSQSTRNKDSALTYAINDRRAYADVYVDTSVTKSFADLNLRFAVAKVEKIGGNETQSLDNVVVKQGNVIANNDLTGTGDYALGTTARTGTMGLGDQYVTTFSGQTITNGAEYTIVTRLSSSYSGAKNETYIPVGLRIHTVDKSELRALINDILHNNTPATPSISENNKGVNPQSWYYSSASFSAYEKAMLDAQTVLQNPRSSQTAIDNAVSSLTNAYNGLVLVEADYSKVEAAIDRANEYEATKHLYTDDSYNALMEAISIYDAETNPDGKIQYGFSVLFQPQVDEWEAEIYDAIEKLEYRLADYSELNEVYAEALQVIENEDMYIDISSVNIAIKNLDWNVKSTEQKKVDDMVEMLREAIDSLVYVKANYDAVNAAVAKIQQYSSSNYTPESYQNLRNIITNINYELDISQQAIVDNYVTQIEQAIKDLDELPADYAELEALLAQIDALIEKYYYPETYQAVKDAAADCEGYDEIGITRQDEIDAMVLSLKTAINNLVMYDADYSVVDDYIDEFNKLDHTQISQSSLDRVNNAINAVNRNLKIDRQSDVDDYALAIRVAIDSLAYNSADYTDVILAVERANTIDRTYWTADSIAALDVALAGVQYGLGVNRQDDVNAMANAINTAITNLKPGPADYTRVNEAINRYLAMNPDYYTPSSVVKVQSIIDEINWNLTKEHQDVVNDYATQIGFALLDLVPAKADYTELIAIIDSIPGDLESQYTKDSIHALENVITSINWDLMARDQAIVVGYQNALTEAIQNLKYLTGDYSDVDKAIAEGRAIIAKNDPPISADSIAEFEALVASLDRTYTIKQEAEIAALAQQVRNAYRQFSHAESIHKASVSLEADRTSSYPGDIITVSVIVGTDYYAAASSFPVLYDANYFELVGSTVSEAFMYEGSYAAASVTGGNINSPAKGYPSSYDEQDRAQWKYALISFAPNAKMNPEAQILDPAQTVVKLQFRVLSSYTATSYKARIWIDGAFQKTEDNTTGKLYIGRYETEAVNNDVVTVGQEIDLTNATVGISIVDPSSPAVFTQLKLALIQEPQYNKSFYTDETYKAYADAVAVGQEVLTHEGSYTVKEQPIIDAATKAINDAFNALELKPANTEPLVNALLEFVPVLPQKPGTGETYEDPAEVYTADSLKAYNDAVSAGKAILDEEGLTVADNERIISAAQKIESTFNSLTMKPFSYKMQMDAALLNNVPAYDAECYTQDTFDAYDDAYKALKSFKDSNPTFLNDDEGMDLIYNLNQAYKALEFKGADLDALKEAINTPPVDEYDNSYPLDYYTDETLSVYQDAIDEGRKIIDTYPPLTILDQEIVDAAVIAINEAKSGLLFKPFSLWEEIASNLELYYSISPDDYTEESFENFDYWGLELMWFWPDPDDIRGEDYALLIIDEFMTAYDNLQLKPADTTRLKEALALENEVGDPSLYDEIKYKAFMDAINAVKAYGEDYFWKASEQETVDQLAQAIYDAYAELDVLPFSKLPELNEAIANGAQYEANVYEENAYAEYLAARKVLEDMIVDAEAEKLTVADDQKAVDAIAEYVAKRDALDNAILDADYSVVNGLINDAQEYLNNESFYDNIDALKAAIEDVETGLKAYDQDIVNGYETAIREALGNVKEKPGDYSIVNDAIDVAEEKIAKVKEFEEMGAPIIPGTLEALEKAIADVNDGLGITQQETINGYAEAIIAATNALDNVSTILIAEGSEFYFEVDSEYGCNYIRGIDGAWGIMDKEEITSQLVCVGSNTQIVVIKTDNGWGTGTIVQHYDDDELINEYYIVVDGDINGSGFADSDDVTILKTHINEFTEPGLDMETFKTNTPWFKTAVDLCQDGWLDVIDLTIVISIVNFDHYRQ